MISLFLLVSQIDDLIAAGFTTIRVYTDPSSTGTFTTLDGTLALVADQESYVYVDANGTTALWYKTAYYGLSVGETDKSDAIRGGQISSYATVPELRDFVGKELTESDLEIQLSLDAASAVIDAYTNHKDGFISDDVASARYYAGSGLSFQFIDECVVITEVAAKESIADTTYTAWASDDWIPFSGDTEWPNFNGLPYDAIMTSAVGDQRIFPSGRTTFLRGFTPDVSSIRQLPMVRITAKWGYSVEPPANVKLACIAQAARWFKRGQSAWADSMASPETFGTLVYRKPLDPDIQMMLTNARLVKPMTGR